MYSIYHFFRHLHTIKAQLISAGDLETTVYNEKICSAKGSGIFPDMVIRANSRQAFLSGGELIEVKDSKSYGVSSFNSTIPSGRKKTVDLPAVIRAQMKKSGDNADLLTERDVYYLVRGRLEKSGVTKVCLVHGSFFQTIPIEELIAQSFIQVLQERLTQTGKNLPDEVIQHLTEIFSEKSGFSRVRDVAGSSIKLRFRVMTEVKSEGNILNTKQYPLLADNTLSLIVPYDSKNERQTAWQGIRATFPKVLRRRLRCRALKHPLNGYFYVFQDILRR